jgi:hypothetical protein
VLATAIGLYWLASSAGNPEAYLFPRIIAGGMGVLAIAILLATFGRLAATAVPTRVAIPWRSTIPALAIFVGYRWALEALGFYSATFAAFLLIVSIYAPDRASVRAFVTRVAVSAAFTGVLYGLFAVALRVQTPRGLLI